MASSIRSFIAVKFPKDSTRGLAHLLRKLSEPWPEYRWVDAPDLHMTLNFLGNVPDEKIPRVCEIMKKTLASHPQFSLEFSGLGAFPKTGRPRVIWLGVGEGKSQLSRIHYDLVEAFEELRLDRDRKAFRPHVTLGRIKDRQRWPDSMISHLESCPPVELPPVMATEVLLFSSHSEKSGPVHTLMDRIPLRHSS